MKISAIYQIKNIVTQQIYVGSAIRFAKRRDGHLHELRRNMHGNSRLQNSFNKYGEASFIFELLEEVTDKNKLIEREQFYIDTLNPYYNICRKAKSALGTKRTEEVKKRMSEFQKAYTSLHGGHTKGRKLSKEHIAAFVKVHKNKIVSESTRNKMRIAMLGKKATEATREKLRISHLGKKPSNTGVPCSPETKAKISASKMGTAPWNKGKNWWTPEIREKQIKARLGRKPSQATRAKMSLAQIGKHSKPVNQFTTDGLFIKRYSSLTEAMTSIGGSIANCITGRSKTAYGYLWKYAS